MWPSATGRCPDRNNFGGLENHTQGYGTELKQQCRRVYGATMSLAVRGSMLPNENSYYSIDPEVVDQWGIPVLRFNFKWSDNEVRQARDMNQTCPDIIGAAGYQVITETGSANGLSLWFPLHREA